MTGLPQHPSELRISAGGERLDVSWTDGVVSSLTARRLRDASRSAGSVRAQADGNDAQPAADVTITDAEMVGAYAVRLFFSDGHDRGIYPWRYLRDLAA